jgi:glyoxylase-like metal-dependent hydrolase (beta-lactamase superfamily II)
MSIQPKNNSIDVKGFFDTQTNTISYAVSDKATKKCAVIDSVADYEPHGGTLTYQSADKLISYIKEQGYTLTWILETHIHADHLSAANYLKNKLGGRTGASKKILDVQNVFASTFNMTDINGTVPFDTLFEDGDTFLLGESTVKILHVPGHTPADLAYQIGDAVFVGDTLFMPDYGTARCDFPGGSAETLYESTQKLFSLPDETRVFLCHDYLPEGRSEYVWETTIGKEKFENIHVKSGTSKEQFVAMRTKRDLGLSMPKLIIPSIQVNLRSGEVPKIDNVATLTIPVNGIFSKK